MTSAPLISAQGIAKTFGDRPLFSDITISVHDGERTALLGVNGAGKSTLLKILAGVEAPDVGMVTSRRGLRSVYVPQEDVFPRGKTVGQVLEDALVAAHIPEREHARAIALALGSVQFPDADTVVDTLSGGWKKRLAIVRGWIVEPELILLDEPTNHLDVEGISWVEGLLAQSSAACVFVSHDRYFIDRLATRVIEINRQYPKGMLVVEGDYVAFQETRAEVLQGLSSAAASLANRVRREVAWLRQGAKARTTKSKKRTETAHELQATLQAIAVHDGKVALDFNASNRKTKELIRADAIGKSLGGRSLFANVSLVIRPGDRLGIVGANGSGKSTFVHTLIGTNQPDTGCVRRASNVRVAFFDQARRQLDKTLTLHRALVPDGDTVVWNGVPLHVTAWAAKFMFAADKLQMPIGNLSGGEQARVLLASMMREPADLLIFDEPTNDLDIQTLEVLEQGFEEFPGAIVLVTHDRYMLDKVATEILGLHQGKHVVCNSLVQWQEFVDSYDAPVKSEREAPPDSERGEPSPNREKAKGLNYNERREYQGIQARIEAAELELSQLQARLDGCDAVAQATVFAELCAAIPKQQMIVEELYHRWSELEGKAQET